MSEVASANTEADPNAAFFFENIRSDNTETRLAAIRSLRSVATRLGPAQTRTAIFPLLLELTKEVDEDVRAAFLEQLSDFGELLGGVTETPRLLEVVEAFLASDEQLVRNKAVDVLAATAANLTPEDVSRFIAPFVVRLFENEWFTARLSALVLFPAAYRAHDPELREKLLALALRLADDKIMSVRRLFIITVPTLLETLGAEKFMKTVFTPASDFFNDPLDTIKMSTIDSFVAILPAVARFPTEHALVLSALRGLVQDKSWRVRYTLVAKYPEIRAQVSDTAVAQALLGDVDALLDDREPEVRSAAAGILSQMFRSGEQAHVDAFFTPKMWARVESLANNAESDVGATVVEQVGRVAPLFGDEQYRTAFVPFLEKVLSSQNPEVKLQGLSVLAGVRTEFRALQHNLVEGLRDMSSNPLWRVRLALVEHIAAVAPALLVENSEPEWTAWCREMLADEANAVREGAVATAVELMHKLDQDWATKFLEERFEFYSGCDNYLLRITTIFLLKRMCRECQFPAVREAILERFLGFAADRIANVRLNVVRAFGELSDLVKTSQYRQEVVAKLESVAQTDPDPDVVFFCREAQKSYAS